MTVWGVVLGTTTGVGVLLLVLAWLWARRPVLADRVLPYLRDLPAAQMRLPSQTSAARGVFGPVLRAVANWIEGVFGGSASIARRLERANLDLKVSDFRVQQATWGLVGLAAAAIPSVLISLQQPARSLPLAIACLVAGLAGVLLRENRLSAQVTQRERQILAEFPILAELLALSVAAGESVSAALDRVVRRSHGEFSAELVKVLADIRTGTPVAKAFDRLAARTGLPVVARFAEGLAVAVERGTPLADVLHAQAADVREASRRALIETGARREVAMMVPVVFLLLPLTVIYAFWPGLAGLRLVTP